MTNFDNIRYGFDGPQCPECGSKNTSLNSAGDHRCKECGNVWLWELDCDYFDDDLPPMCPDCGFEMDIFDDEAEKYFCPNCGGSINA